MTKPLTKRQAEILAFIQSTAAENGAPPTLREIARHFDIGSTNAVNDHLLALERKGWIAKGGHQKSRSLRVVGAAPPSRRAFAWDTLDPRVREAALRRLRSEWAGRVSEAMIEKLGA